MRSSRSIISLTSIILLSLSNTLSSMAQKMYDIKDVPNVQLQDYRQFVSDPEHLLSTDDREILNREILEMRDSLTVQVAIVVLPAINERKYSGAREFANELFNQWGIGIKNADNGLLILLLTADGQREITFETGYAVEGVLTDGLSKLIQTKVMVPYFKEEAWGTGLIAGLTEIRKAMEGESDFLHAEEERLQQEKAFHTRTIWFLVIWNLFGIIVLYLYDLVRSRRLKKKAIPYKAYLERREKLPASSCFMAVIFLFGYLVYITIKAFVSNQGLDDKLQQALQCEHCGQRGFVKYLGATVVRNAKPGLEGLMGHKFVCGNCHYTNEVMMPIKYIPPIGRSGGSGPWRGGGGFGGTSGGSWGGGMSGGGGASTRF